ncbi:MAG: beta-ketoacyl synthase [Bacteroidetes bacterium]|nr:MAG: beta-ketoacyl synthase [Bacteroidota bacterium]
MREVFVASDNIFSPLGRDSAVNFEQLQIGRSGIRQHHKSKTSAHSFYASLFQDEVFDPGSTYTKFEQALIYSIEDALKRTRLDARDDKTIFILSSTKGNISLLESGELDNGVREKITLHHSASLIANRFGFIHQPIVVSHACISGLLAIITGMRMLQRGLYKHAIIAGADIITRFVLSGFHSFQAISPEPCKPFDANRKGITLGEGASTVILSVDANMGKSDVQIRSGSVTNDANHISGPSRTGDELHHAIRQAMEGAEIGASDIDFISAHGTATLYNDDMEARAINLSKLEHVPVNSLKGCYGHTLGAAGLIESVVSIHSLRQNLLIPTVGFSEIGTVEPIQVIDKMQSREMSTCLKTASGFGGCNAAMVIVKE